MYNMYMYMYVFPLYVLQALKNMDEWLESLDITGNPFIDTLDTPLVPMATAVPMTTSEFKPTHFSPSPTPPLMLVNLPPISPPPPPPKAIKMKKKLTKHLVKSSKYAPGDYTEVPMLRPLPATPPNSGSVNPYHGYLISSTVDHRLLHSLELPAELALQGVAMTQYEAVLRAVVAAGPPTEGRGEGEVVSPPGEGAGERGGEGGLEEVCEFVQKCLKELLSSLTGLRSSVELVTLLQFWSELNGLLQPQPTPGRVGPGGSVAENSPQEPLLSGVECFCSRDLLVALMECLCHDHTPSSSAHSSHAHSRDDATWQIGLSLILQLICHLSTPHTPSTLPLHPSQLSRFLRTYFLSIKDNDEVGVSKGVASELIQRLVFLRLVGCAEGDGVTRGSGGGVMNGSGGESGDGVTRRSGGGGDVTSEGVGGVHVLLQLLVELLEER